MTKVIWSLKATSFASHSFLEVEKIFTAGLIHTGMILSFGISKSRGGELGKCEMGYGKLWKNRCVRVNEEKLNRQFVADSCRDTSVFAPISGFCTVKVLERLRATIYCFEIMLSQIIEYFQCAVSDYK